MIVNKLWKTKTCCICHQPIKRHPNCSDTTWAGQKFCGTKCRNTQINERHKHKKTTQARVRRLRDKNYEPSVSATHLILTMPRLK